jgi:hypothetical protein
VQTPTLHQAQAAFEDHDAFLYSVLGAASVLRRATELLDPAAAGVPEPSGERSASISEDSVLDALLGLVALKTVAENALGDMESAVQRAGPSGRKAPQVRRSGHGGLLR